MLQVRYLQGEGERLRKKIRHLERNLQASHQVQVHTSSKTVTGADTCLLLVLSQVQVLASYCTVTGAGTCLLLLL